MAKHCLIKSQSIRTVYLRSSHQRSYLRKGVLRNFTKFTGKHLSGSLAQVFSCEFCKISKNTFLQNTSGRLLLLFFEMSLPGGKFISRL